MSGTPVSAPDMGPPAPNAVAQNAVAQNAVAQNAVPSGEQEKDPEDVIMEIYDIILRLEAKVDRILEAGKPQKGGTRRPQKRR